LATIDPITAYRLNGKTNIMQSFDILHDYFDAVKKQFPGEEEVIQDQINSTIYSLKPEVIKEAISDLEDEIKDLALSINPWIWFKVRKTLQSSKDRIRNEGAKKIDKLLDKLMPKITQ
jgi:NDP-sugar pyrophosphorylase family protein